MSAPSSISLIKVATKPIDNSEKEKFDCNFFANCQKLLGEEVFNKWFAALEVLSCSQSEIIVSAPSKFVRDWLNREFFRNKSFLANLKQSYPHLLKISAVHFAQENNADFSDESCKGKNSKTASEKPLNLSKYDNVFAYGTELNNRFTFENFIAAKHNKIALSMAKVASNFGEAPKLFEDKIPLFIHGAVGMGKTHLAQAIAWHIKEKDKSMKVVYLSAEKFMFHFVRSIRSNHIMDFKEKMRSIDVLIVDDMQFIAGKDSTQQEFMNCFNSLVEDNKQVVLVCDRCPNELKNIDEKLKSRISGGMIVNFKTPDFADRLLILKGKAQMMNFEVPQEILHFIAQNIRGSIRDLEGALKKLFTEKTIGEQELSNDLAKNVLASYMSKASAAVISVEKIQKIAAEFYGIKLADLCSSSRIRVNVKARQVAMFLAKTRTTESLQAIGQKFAGRNHATVIHSVKIIAELSKTCQKVASEIEAIEVKLSV